MAVPWSDWDHVVKVDPEKPLVEGETFADIPATGTDAIVIGGTTGMTDENLTTVIEGIGVCDLPVYIEPTHADAVGYVDRVDGYFIPVVFNAGDVTWITGAHKEWVRLDDIDWTQTYPEAYIVLNPAASVAQYTEADCNPSSDDITALATVAERIFGQEIVYIERSGTLGDPETVAAAGDRLDDAALFYGGGVRDYEAAYGMAIHADTVVVGDLLHEEGVEAVSETVKGAKDAH